MATGTACPCTFPSLSRRETHIEPYTHCVLIVEDCDELLLEWLNMATGVVDWGVTMTRPRAMMEQNEGWRAIWGALSSLHGGFQRCLCDVTNDYHKFNEQTGNASGSACTASPITACGLP
mmetsp:Transcript_23900/g.49721  ORF Transcript_23900/g.49721 Transcript_23900/m.49721 type:complete len:120 (+) Transcript_23900:466-825(+)